MRERKIAEESSKRNYRRRRRRRRRGRVDVGLDVKKYREFKNYRTNKKDE